MLIVIPIGLWIFSLACDLIRLAGVTADSWSTVAFFGMIAGLIGALCAAVPGFIDVLFYKGGRSTGEENRSGSHGDQSHGSRALCDNYLAARPTPEKFGRSLSAPVVLSMIGVALLFVSGWLGGQKVHVYGVGVEGRE